MRLGERPIEADIKTLRVLLARCGLAQPVGWLPFLNYGGLAAGITTSPLEVFVATVPDRGHIIKTWTQATYVATTNDGSNYWRIRLQRDFSSNVATIWTYADTVATWTKHTETPNLSVTSAYKYYSIYVDKVGSPGALYLAGPLVWAI